MKLNKIILCHVNSNLKWAFEESKKNGAAIFELFKKTNKIQRIIRYFWLRLNLPFSSIWYCQEWKKIVSNSTSIEVVIQMSYLTMSLPQYINRINSNAKVIAWYWDIVKKNTLPKNIKGQCDLWSFDPKDCQKYKIHFNHQYYFKSLVNKIDCGKDEWDVLYIGRDCNRGEFLTSLYKDLSKFNIKCFFKIINPYSDKIPKELVSEQIDYDVIRKLNSNTKAILEIPRPGQSGATVRLMEALFNKKKIITNNPYVKNELFYNENNIFVLGDRPLESLKEFLDSDYDHSVDKFIDEYDFKNWLSHFN